MAFYHGDWSWLGYSTLWESKQQTQVRAGHSGECMVEAGAIANEPLCTGRVCVVKTYVRVLELQVMSHN